MPTVGRRDLVMLVIGLGVDDELNDSLGGITRLQKYLFLLDREAAVQADRDGFRFEPYKAGPYSAKVYDDLEFLENLGLLQSQVTGSATEEEAAEVERLSIGDLFGTPSASGMGSSAEDTVAPEERRFFLTDPGVAHVKRLLDNPEYRPVVDAVRRVKSRFAGHSLDDLLFYVYTKFPEMTTESEIRTKVLRRGRSR